MRRKSRIIQKPLSLHHTLALLATLAFAQRAQAFDLEFKTRVRPAPDRDLQVEATISGWSKSEITFSFPDRFGPATGIYRNVRDFRVWNNGHELPTSFDAPASEDESAKYGAHVSPGEIRVSYRVAAPDYSNYRLLGNIYGVVQEDHATVSGATTYFSLDAPARDYVSVKFSFDTPPDWEVLCSSVQVDKDTCAPDLLGSPGNIEDAIISQITPLGHWNRQTVQVGGMALELLRGGKWAFSFEDFVKAVQPPLVWQIQKMGGHNRARFQIITDTYPADVTILGMSSGGQRLFDSTISMAMRDLSPTDFTETNLHTIAHEFFHTFGWQFADADREKLTWFNEGMTDYMSWRSLAETSLPINTMAKFLRRYIETYWNQTISKSISIREASQDRWESTDRPWTSEQLEFALYEQVDLVDFIVDSHAQILGMPTRLPDVMKELWQRYGKARLTFSEQDIFAVAEAMLGDALKNEWFRYLSTNEELPFANTLKDLRWRLEDSWRADFGVYAYEVSGKVIIPQMAGYLDRDAIALIPLKVGDVIRMFNGKPVNAYSDFVDIIYQLPLSGEIPFQVERGGKVMDLLVPIRPYHRVKRLDPPAP